MHKLDELTFGAEIECIIPKNKRNEIRDLTIEYGFSYGTDISIHNPDEEIYTTIEIRTGILNVGASEDRQLFGDYVDKLKSLGAFINNSTGGHIHIGVQNIVQSDDLLAKITLFVHLFKNYGNIESALYQINGGTSRATGQYAKSVKPLLEEMKSDKAVGFISTMAKHDARYTSLNVMSYAEHKTVEFRIFVGSLDRRVWDNNILLSAKLVIKSANNKRVPEFRDYVELFKYFKLNSRVYTRKIEYLVSSNTYRIKNENLKSEDKHYSQEQVRTWIQLLRWMREAFNTTNRDEVYLKFRFLMFNSTNIMVQGTRIVFRMSDDILTAHFRANYVEFSSFEGNVYYPDRSYDTSLNEYPVFGENE